MYFHLGFLSRCLEPKPSGDAFYPQDPFILPSFRQRSEWLYTEILKRESEQGRVGGAGYGSQSAGTHCHREPVFLKRVSCRIGHNEKRLETTAINSPYPKGKVSKAWKTPWRVFVRPPVLRLPAPGSRIPAGGSPWGWCSTFVPPQI